MKKIGVNMIDNEENVSSISEQSQKNTIGKKSLLTIISTRVTSFFRVEAEDNTKMDTNELAEARTSMASKRTLMAADRTLMAWVRTALSMISFGFTIYKVLESLHSSGSDVAIDASPKNVGLFLIGLGTVSMALGTIEYWQNLKELRRTLYFNIFRPAFIMALIISIAGMFIFISVITKVL